MIYTDYIIISTGNYIVYYITNDIINGIQQPKSYMCGCGKYYSYDEPLCECKPDRTLRDF